MVSTREDDAAVTVGGAVARDCGRHLGLRSCSAIRPSLYFQDANRDNAGDFFSKPARFFIDRLECSVDREWHLRLVLRCPGH